MNHRLRAVHRARIGVSPSRRTIAVIGAGASGTLAAVHLLRLPGAGVRVVLIDRTAHGPGVAYATDDPRHRLNVRASGMSAFDDDPDDLLRWCRVRGIDAAPDDFLPRALFGEYLRSLLKRFGDADRLELITGTVAGIEPAVDRDALRVELADGRSLVADVGVLALGNAAPAPLPGIEPSEAYVANPWTHNALDRAVGARKIIIVGSGLTAVDIALSVSAINPETEVCAVSRHGWLPRMHMRQRTRARAIQLPPNGRGGLVALVDAIAESVSADPSQWRDVIDGLRPHTDELWQQLSLDDRRLFLRELKSWWDVHRHRMAPAVGDELERLQRAGRLTVMAGAFHGACVTGTEVLAEVRTRSLTRRLHGDLLINATGPSSPVGGSADQLTRRLLARGDAQPDALGLGFACDADGRLLSDGGVCADRLFTLGPPRRGELFESFAIPEIRAQAEALSRVLRSCPLGDRGSAQPLAAAAGSR